ncbi:hypothetical protein CERSUDRAFT_114564 [Gelatoporia subvermispora B]|uniref:RING-type domain-containing protein n=1 Tax=Ceriporiopsis subvermispora (strain B) TaxID=914234 RepID=M2PNC0_CERS8|nr:hypothetical protein CERSUDRAFT_114564 [Gelatoporia subvermispora B]
MADVSDAEALRRTQSMGNIIAEPRRALTSRRSEGRTTRSTPRLAGAPTNTEPSAAAQVAQIEEGPLRAQSPFSIADLRQTAAGERVAATPPAATATQGPTSLSNSWIFKVFRFLGYGGPNARERRELVSLIWNLSLVAIQFVAIITLLAYSAHHESPTMPGKSEWDACNRPLGIWDSLWVVRAALSGLLSVWTYQKNRAAFAAATARAQDIEGRILQNQAAAQLPANRRGTVTARNPPARDTRPTPLPLNNQQHTHDTEILTNVATPWHRQVLYDRLQVLLTFASFGWFLTAHILEYTSISTCRVAAPHLWWLTFGILCLLYLILLEIFLMGLVFFILGPVIYLLYNIVLLCLGRHPLQNPHYISPTIGGLPKSIVDQIPLVLYIPAPPEGTDNNKGPAKPQPAHLYPPRPSKPAAPRRRRFIFLRSKKAAEDAPAEKGGASKTPLKKPEEMTWEDNWEQGDFPFVRLEENRAACAICLLDFEEPKKAPWAANVSDKEKAADVDGETVLQPALTANGPEHGRPDDSVVNAIQEIQVEDASGEERERLRLDDAGEGPQPLRLLKCGHVFHKTCLDPWLTDVSGRCPVCQQAVEIPQPNSKEKRSRRTL